MIANTNQREESETMTTYEDCAWDNDLRDSEHEALLDYIDNEHIKPTDEADDEVIRRFRDAYQGMYDSMADFAEEMTYNIHRVPDYLEGHINWESMAEEYRHDYWISDNGHVFSNY